MELTHVHRQTDPEVNKVINFTIDLHIMVLQMLQPKDITQVNLNSLSCNVFQLPVVMFSFTQYD